VVIAGPTGPELTVNVTTLVDTEVTELVNTALYWVPLSEMLVAGVT